MRELYRAFFKVFSFVDVLFFLFLKFFWSFLRFLLQLLLLFLSWYIFFIRIVQFYWIYLELWRSEVNILLQEMQEIDPVFLGLTLIIFRQALVLGSAWILFYYILLLVYVIEHKHRIKHYYILPQKKLSYYSSDSGNSFSVLGST